MISTLQGERVREVVKRRRTDLRTLQRQIRGELDWITMRALVPRGVNDKFRSDVEVNQVTVRKRIPQIKGVLDLATGEGDKTISRQKQLQIFGKDLQYDQQAPDEGVFLVTGKKGDQEFTRPGQLIQE